MLDPQAMREQITQIEGKREFLVKLLEQPNLGTLRIDVNQAIEEMDDLIDEFKRTFPYDAMGN
ncbi:hypothetical protein JOY44_15875 [Phormidium sp. CLA17]|uniref:hypothetical protein n=1 Tax=Leptolyngbya sp. Cla-17 TaxID=2803751 RepID=UPI0014928B79|nr:hypothetical protein [Leptolyngbya sp. Cla-17]MBM0743067.1 hypothetical protein [Leptolyngbya sp. Cla-17]